MENKKYIDKVIGSLVRGSKIDYENKEVNTPFSPSPLYFSPSLRFPSVSFHSLILSFTKYCKNIYGLTVDEVEYVWEEYRNIMLEKVNQ